MEQNPKIKSPENVERAPTPESGVNKYFQQEQKEMPSREEVRSKIESTESRLVADIAGHDELRGKLGLPPATNEELANIPAFANNLNSLRELRMMEKQHVSDRISEVKSMVDTGSINKQEEVREVAPETKEQVAENTQSMENISETSVKPETVVESGEEILTEKVETKPDIDWSKVTYEGQKVETVLPPPNEQQSILPEQKELKAEINEEVITQSSEVVNGTEQIPEDGHGKNVDRVDQYSANISNEVGRSGVDGNKDTQDNQVVQGAEENLYSENETPRDVPVESMAEEQRTQENHVEDDIEVARKMETKKLLENSSDSMRRLVNVLRYREDDRLADLFERPDFLLVEAQNLEDIEQSNEIDLGEINTSLKRLAQGFYEMTPHGPNASHDDLDNLHDLNSSMNDLGHSVYDLVKSIKENYRDSYQNKEIEFNELIKNGEFALVSLEEAISKVQRRRDYGEFIQV